MLCINNTYTDAYFNIAAEEYLLKNLQEDIFMLYRNEPSIIIGKHQNVWAEVNLKFAQKNRIKIVRRFSGGGAVFHDLGNFNLTFIEKGNNLNFDKYTDLMTGMLSGFGISAETDGRRALTINGLKISGSAQAIHKNRSMYHATLLFSSDLTALTASLESNALATIDKGQKKIYVKSVKSPVTNMIEHLETPVGTDAFGKLVMNHFLGKDTANTPYEFTERDITEIKKLKDNKYATEDWNLNACASNYNNKQKAGLLAGL